MPRLTHPLVVFDLDGTVTDTLAATYRCFAQAMAPVLGRAPDEAEIRARFGPADQRIIADWAGPAEAERAVARLYACYERELAGAGPFPGMRELLRDLRAAGRRLGLFTGRGRPSTERILALTRLQGAFDASVTGEEAGRPKPAPDGVLRLCERTGFRAEHAVVVGDSALDLRAARAAGAEAVGALWGTREREVLEASGEPLAGSVAELRALLLGGRGAVPRRPERGG
jgi:HAD superfamily hydrolase (TIGR01509 family)